MALAEVQRALARLYTDADTRERFLADAAAAGAALGLSAQETAQLAELPAQQLRFFAASLRRKRLGEVAKLLPLTHQALGAQFARLFWRYADSYLPGGTKKHPQDAIAFAAFIADAAPLDPPWAGDLARYEAAWLQGADPTRRAVWQRFRYPAGQLARAVAAGAAPPSPRFTLTLWVRLWPGSRLRHLAITLPHRARAAIPEVGQTRW
jgi:hypothetical protein